MVAAHARVYVPKELAPLGDGYASLQDVGGGALVQLAVDEGEDLAILAMRLASDRSEGSSPRSIQVMYLSRHSTLWGAGSTSMASSALYPSRRESTDASFEGSSSMGSAPTGFEGVPEGSVQFEGCDSRVMDGWVTSRAKTFSGTVIRPDAILVSSSTSSLYRRGT
jgi:hypothetical protein